MLLFLKLMILCAQATEKQRFNLTPVERIDSSRNESKTVQSHVSYVEKTRNLDFIYLD